jgi:hypothetical protein
MTREEAKAYGIFCMAIAINDKNKPMRKEWFAHALYFYNRFLESEYNDPNKLEWDCINEFVKVVYIVTGEENHLS